MTHQFGSVDGLIRLWDQKAAIVFIGWLSYNALCWKILPGDWVEGLPLRDGSKKQYKINGAFPIDRPPDARLTRF